MLSTNIIPAIAESVRKNWHRQALSDFNGSTLTYGDLAAQVEKMHLIFEAAGLRPGDKVALCARNSAQWAASFVGALTYGAVVVPLLHEFHPDNVEHLVIHSDARILITEKHIFDTLDSAKFESLEAVLLIPGLLPQMCGNSALKLLLDNLDAEFAKRYPAGMSPGNINYSQPDAEATALINYTSGSTGNPKGVMLSYNNLWSNVRFGLANISFLHPGDGMVSMLPLAHMYGLVFEFLFPLCRGCHITFLGRVPSPKVVLQAFDSVKPKLVITVPLVMEKIVKTKVFPILERPLMRFLLKVPGVNALIYSKVRKQLLAAFGGSLQQLILGGAALSSDVEDFLRRIKFPFTVGYGMTECAPLVTYCWWEKQRPHSCGFMVDDMEAKVASDDPVRQPGVLSVRGANVMQGYYKNEEATAEVLSADGWLNTGDICTIDPDGYVYLRGRAKNMILSSSGQNVYPEEIEVKLNNLPLVAESVVVDRDGKIIALVHPDYEAAHKLGLTDDETDARVLENLPVLNAELPAYSRVSAFEIMREEFEKTPKHSIRRFIYK